MPRSIQAAFLLSGLAGLMHEVVWAKLLVQLIGTTAHAQAAVLTVYMGGLALGSIGFGGRADRHGRPLGAYVALEYGIGAYCLLLPLILGAVGQGYIALAGAVFESAGLKFLLRFLLALLAVLLPAVLMGGTLPLLARHLISRVQDTRRHVAGLYALNSFGAVLGAGIAGFVTLPSLGVHPSLVVAALLNFVAGTLLVPLAWRERTKGRSGTPAPDVESEKLVHVPSPSYGTGTYAVTLFALVLSGFAAMGYEVLFVRIISLSFGSTTHSFTVMLMSFITGIGLGGVLVSRLPVARPLWLLGLSQLVVVVALLAATPLVSRLPYFVALLRIALHDARYGFELYQLGKAGLCLAVLLLPTTCLGVGFPLVAQVQARHPRRIGFHVGSTYAWNTLGNVLGVALTSLVLLPRLGLLDAFHLNLALNVTAGLAILAVATEVVATRRLATIAAGGLAVACYVLIGSGWSDPVNFGRNHLKLVSGPPASADAETRARHPASSFDAWKRTYVARPDQWKIFHFEEEAHASVLVLGNDDIVRLLVNTKTDASTAGLDLDTQLLLAHAPLFLRPDARTLLVIGHGSGITVGSALRHPIQRADVVEISHAVLGVDRFFAAHNYHVLDDSRVHAYLDDAQSFLRAVPRRYDVIISEPSNPWIAGISGLFTVEFFKDARRKLNPRGLFTLWLHQYEQSDAAVQLILRTLESVFPYAMLFHEQSYGDVVAVASVVPIQVDFSAMERRYDEPAIRNDLARVGITNLAAFLTHHGISQQAFPQIIGSGPLNRLGRQRLEYRAIRSIFLDEAAGIVASADPLINARRRPDTLLDGYISYRAAAGDPVRKAELVDAARHASVRGDLADIFRSTLMARAERAPTGVEAPARAARGAVPDPPTAGLHEAVYWARRRAAEGDAAGAAAFARRARELWRTGGS